MPYLFVRQQVLDFDRWYEVFKSHEDAQREAGLKDLQLFRDINDPNLIVCIFKVADIEKAKAFTSSPQASEAQTDSGIVGSPEMLFLERI